MRPNQAVMIANVCMIMLSIYVGNPYWLSMALGGTLTNLSVAAMEAISESR
jgi:hypothetical protein